MLNDDVQHTCLGHKKWKRRLIQAIQSGRSELSPEQAELDSCCDFGRWLYALPPETQKSAYWGSVQHLHAQFHKQAALVLRLALDGHTQLAELAVAPGSGFDQISSELSHELTHWARTMRNRPTLRLKKAGRPRLIPEKS